MQNSLKEMYRVEKSNIEKSYEYHLALKNNEEFEKRVDDTFLAFANLLKSTYPDIAIETPKLREKSNKSLKNKITKLEIERLCKLYAIDEITDEEKDSLFNLIIDKVNIKDKTIIYDILNGQIDNLDKINQLMELEEIETHDKTALLRVLNTNYIKENKEELSKTLEEKYGLTAAIKTNDLANNILHWECIQNLDEDMKQKLHSPFDYLCVKDLRGFKFVIANVPDDLQTDNEELRDLLNRRKEASIIEKSRYNDLCCIELEKDFVNKLMNDKELLEKLNIEILPGGYKHKQKQNGYIAEHLKFFYKDRPEYVIEMQLRSTYREDLSRAHGKAAHDKRSGKKRVFPSIENKRHFIESMKNGLPQYKILKPKGNELKLHKCNMAENMLEYFLGYVDLGSKEYEQAIEYIEEYEEENKLGK